LLVDYISPLYVGNFNILHGSSNQGQKHVLINIALNYLNDSNESSRLIIYITYSRKEANGLYTQLSKLKRKDFVIFTLSDTPSDSEYYYLPKLALTYSKEASKTSSILFCFDDITSYVLKEKNIANTAKAYVLK
jgi:hypothetical protein